MDDYNFIVQFKVFFFGLSINMRREVVRSKLKNDTLILGGWQKNPKMSRRFQISSKNELVMLQKSFGWIFGTKRM